MRSLQEKGLDNQYFLWIDDNLSIDYAWKYIKREDFELMKNFTNFGRVGCFKGFSPASFQENTLAHRSLFERQFDILSRWIKTGIDVYGYITLTTSSMDGMRTALKLFMDRVQNELGEHFLLRTIPLEVTKFKPLLPRIKSSQENALKNQYDVLSSWKDELQTRYSRRELQLPIYRT
jgi:hypothetical protein